MANFSEEDIRAKVINILSELLKVDESDIKESSSLIDNLGADSLDVVEVCMAIEEEFKLPIPESDWEENNHNVGEIVALVAGKLHDNNKNRK